MAGAFDTSEESILQLLDKFDKTALYYLPSHIL